jgi:hypothetical protein
MHLKPEELVDLAEGTVIESSVPHLSACAACRGQLEALRLMTAEARDFEVPEPSPLFWDHLSSRVRDAIAEDHGQPSAWLRWLGLGTSPTWRGAWFWKDLREPRALGIVVAAGIAVVVALGTLTPLAHRIPGMGTLRSDGASSVAPDQDTIDSVAGMAARIGLSGAPGTFGSGSSGINDANESSLGLVTDLTAGLDWDTANEAGLASDDGAEHEVTHMTNDELRELQRLLKAELARSGA